MGILYPLLAPRLTTVSMTTTHGLRECRKEFDHYFILPSVSFIEYVFPVRYFALLKGSVKFGGVVVRNQYELCF
jgi:hypothetical protein